MEKTDKESDQLVLKTSRISFLSNYLVAILAIVFLVLFMTASDLEFNLFPKTKDEMLFTLEILGVLAVISGLIEQPEWVRFRTHYIITNNEVIKEEGILNKHRLILPYQSVADVRADRDFLGRLLNYGTVSVSGFKAGSDIDMKGIKNPREMHEMVQNRVNMIREGQMKFFGDGKKEKEEKE